MKVHRKTTMIRQGRHGNALLLYTYVLIIASYTVVLYEMPGMLEIISARHTT